MLHMSICSSPRTQGDGGSIDEVLEQQGISGQSMCHTTSSIALPSSPKTAAEKSEIRLLDRHAVASIAFSTNNAPH